MAQGYHTTQNYAFMGQQGMLPVVNTLLSRQAEAVDNTRRNIAQLKAAQVGAVGQASLKPGGMTPYEWQQLEQANREIERMQGAAGVYYDQNGQAHWNQSVFAPTRMNEYLQREQQLNALLDLGRRNMLEPNTAPYNLYRTYYMKDPAAYYKTFHDWDAREVLKNPKGKSVAELQRAQDIVEGRYTLSPQEVAGIDAAAQRMRSQNPFWNTMDENQTGVGKQFEGYFKSDIPSNAQIISMYNPNATPGFTHTPDGEAVNVPGYNPRAEETGTYKMPPDWAGIQDWFKQWMKAQEDKDKLEKAYKED